jgi:hypothetical protein
MHQIAKTHQNRAHRCCCPNDASVVPHNWPKKNKIEFSIVLEVLAPQIQQLVTGEHLIFIQKLVKVHCVVHKLVTSEQFHTNDLRNQHVRPTFCKKKPELVLIAASSGGPADESLLQEQDRVPSAGEVQLCSSSCASD